MKYDLDNPELLGVSGPGLEGLRERALRAIDDGPLPSLQIALARKGRLVLFETFGSQDNDTRYNIYSCTKPLVASAVWRLMGAGLIKLAQPVAHYFPEFAANGKGGVTVEQLFCHTSGFPEASTRLTGAWGEQFRRGLSVTRAWETRFPGAIRKQEFPSAC